jgi:tetratricopeptide (TPR) repeat protein
MRKLIILLSVFTIASCSTLKKSPLSLSDADKALKEKNYSEALTILEKLIATYEANGTSDTTLAYEKAGNAASALGDTLKAERYYKMAVYHQTATAPVYVFLADYYKKLDNLSKEVMALEGLAEHYPTSAEAEITYPRLFTYYVNTSQWDQAVGIWMKIPQDQKVLPLLSDWLNVCIKRKDAEAADIAAQEVLTADSQNRSAMLWKAQRFYDKGEARYQQEMADYEKNKTHAQYAKLTKGLEFSTSDFRSALKLFEKVYKMQSESSVALMISNIYARFGDEANTTKFRRLSELK